MLLRNLILATVTITATLAAPIVAPTDPINKTVTGASLPEAGAIAGPVPPANGVLAGEKPSVMFAKESDVGTPTRPGRTTSPSTKSSRKRSGRRRKPSGAVKQKVLPAESVQNPVVPEANPKNTTISTPASSNQVIAQSNINTNVAPLSVQATMGTPLPGSTGADTLPPAAQSSPGGLNSTEGISTKSPTSVPPSSNQAITPPDIKSGVAAPPSVLAMTGTPSSASTGAGTPPLVAQLSTSGLNSVGATTMGATPRLVKRVTAVAPSRLHVDFLPWIKEYGLHKSKRRCKTIHKGLRTAGFQCRATIEVAGPGGKEYKSGWVKQMMASGYTKDKTRELAKYRAELDLVRTLEYQRDAGNLVAVIE